MKLIPLDSIKKLLKSRLFNQETKEGGHVLSLSPTVIDELDTLETIDPIEKIEKMQEEYKKDPTVGDGSFDYDIEVLLQDARYSVLQELKSRLYPLTQK